VPFLPQSVQRASQLEEAREAAYLLEQASWQPEKQEAHRQKIILN
jgi:hypothetical protein